MALSAAPGELRVGANADGGCACGGSTTAEQVEALLDAADLSGDELRAVLADLLGVDAPEPEANEYVANMGYFTRDDPDAPDGRTPPSIVTAEPDARSGGERGGDGWTDAMGYFTRA